MPLDGIEPIDHSGEEDFSPEEALFMQILDSDTAEGVALRAAIHKALKGDSNVVRLHFESQEEELIIQEAMETLGINREELIRVIRDMSPKMEEELDINDSEQIAGFLKWETPVEDIKKFMETRAAENRAKGLEQVEKNKHLIRREAIRDKNRRL